MGYGCASEGKEIRKYPIPEVFPCRCLDGLRVMDQGWAASCKNLSTSALSFAGDTRMGNKHIHALKSMETS